MTNEQIDAVLERVRTWAERRQEDAVRLLLTMEAEEIGPYRLSDEDRADIEAAIEEIERGEVATDAEVEKVFARYRR